ncbi:MAG: hypothetical protein AAFQ66_03105 [Pseudomonadota bacterium]
MAVNEQKNVLTRRSGLQRLLDSLGLRVVVDRRLRQARKMLALSDRQLLELGTSRAELRRIVYDRPKAN